ncbi:PD-(D/E)XK nuclease-like domain-containing protein [Providencia rettgeri]|uniref:PD-(D/E)XK nuclease-like domain-containing protein n=1 Tax=Providencia rettgeri TaxID=587 RepID=UPI001EE74037|nr:PD-(D/E)XK nuclease-like domain-containing protein [Providencia rettgeri]
MKEGIYYNISNEDYHNGLGISKSQLDLINEMPAEYIWSKDAPIDEEKIKPLEIGTALHCLLLEPDEYYKRYKIGPDVNRRTNEGKKKEKEFFDMCEKEGITPITHDDNRKLMIMRDSALAHPIAKWCLEADGVSESSIYWTDKETDVLCRCRPDRIITAHNYIVDVKSSGDIEKFDYEYYNYRYHVQDAFYSDGYKEVTGITPTFLFLVVSTKIDCGKYPVRTYVMSEEAKSAGRTAYKHNLLTYAECLKTDEWAGIRTLSLPRWAKELRNE